MNAVFAHHGLDRLVDAVRTAMPGDVNQNGWVDSNDVTVVVLNYGTETGATWADGDFDGDGDVDDADVASLDAHYGTHGLPAANTQEWGLDALGNWAGFTDQGETQTREHNAANETGEISGDLDWIDPAYDAAGNMTSGPKPGAETDRLHLTYDAWNRLVAAYADDEGEAGDLIAEYQYDGQGRRTAKIVRQVDEEEYVTYERTDYQYDEAWQAIEERSDSFEDLEGEGGALETPAETPAVQWLWDVRYVDSPVLRWRDADLDSETGYLGLEETLYACNDANMSVTALIDPVAGEAVERYVYDPYGKATCYDGDWDNASSTSAYANEILYCGYRFDPETGLDHVRYRYYHPTLGRWIQRDPVGYSPGMGLYEYAASVPSTARDATGLTSSRLQLSLEVMQRTRGGGSIELGSGGPQVGLTPSPSILNDMIIGLNQLRHTVSTRIEMKEDRRSESRWSASLIVAVSASQPQAWQICPRYDWTIRVHNVCCESGLVRVTVRSFAGSNATAQGPSSGLVSVPLGGQRALSPDTYLAITYVSSSVSTASWASRVWIDVSVTCEESGPIYA